MLSMCLRREQIVSSMVRLKYGTHTLLSSKLIVEAEKSLSQWMAAQKSSQVGPTLFHAGGALPAAMQEFLPTLLPT